MKKLILLSLIVLFAGCGNNPTPAPTPGPGPGPTPTPSPVPTPTPTPTPGPKVMTFQIVGKKIEMKAQMKADPLVSLEEMRGALRATAAQLEGISISEVLVK